MMITSLHIKNFKSHQDTNLQLGALTLLCGQHGVGKSSVIQTLLLLRQTYQKDRLGKGLDLNSPLCYVGTALDAIYEFSESDQIEFNISLGTDKELQWIFDVKKFEEDTSFIDLVQEKHAVGLADISFFGKNFQYISAARNASYEADDYKIQEERQLSLEEGKGELTAHFLFYYQDNEVLNELQHPDAEFTDLLTQTTAWEREIGKGVNIHPQQKGLNYEIKYSFDTELGTTREFTTRNVGFGLSYALPVIVAILSAPKGSLIIIENPEAHLHPYGQAKLAELMCLAAQAGIQIIVETHSDHIINGTLVQCKKFETEGKGIDHKNVKIYYFDRDESEHATKTTEIEVLEGGRIKRPPIGFFDQIGKDLRVLMSTSNLKRDG